VGDGCFQNIQLKLHCVEGGQSDKPLMLFLHGFPEFWYSWRYQLKEFCKDYRLLLMCWHMYAICCQLTIDLSSYDTTHCNMYLAVLIKMSAHLLNSWHCSTFLLASSAGLWLVTHTHTHTHSKPHEYCRIVQLELNYSLEMLINGLRLPYLQVLLAQRLFSVSCKVGSHNRK